MATKKRKSKVPRGLEDMELEGKAPSLGQELARVLQNSRSFVREIIGAAPTWQQDEFLERLDEMIAARLKKLRREPLTEREQELVGRFGISVRSGKGVGKDAMIAWAILYCMFALPFLKGMATATTDHQLKDVLWAEIAKWLRYSKEHGKGDILNALLEHRSEKLSVKGNAKDWFFTHKTANVRGTEEEQAETLGGFHEENLLIVVDEASAVPNPVFIPLESTLTRPMNIAILIANPTRPTGYFADSHGTHREHWECLHFDAEDSPLVSREHIDRLARKYGKDSPYYQVYVKGEFSQTAPDILIPLHLVLDAVEREIEADPNDPLVAGVDVAYMGDDKSIILARKGCVVQQIQEFTKIDTMALAGWVGVFIREEDPHGVAIDTIGYGAGVYDRLRELGWDRVFAVNVAESPSHEELYRNLRAELWFKLRARFENRTISIPRDDELIGELSSIRLDDPESTGKRLIMSKKKMREKYKIPSPNKADALMLTEFFNLSSLAIASQVDEEERMEWRFHRREVLRAGKSDEDSWMVA